MKIQQSRQFVESFSSGCEAQSYSAIILQYVDSLQSDSSVTQKEMSV